MLPDELRDKEENELKSVRKKPRLFRIEMSSPRKEKIDQPLSSVRSSLLSRLFARNLKPASPVQPSSEVVSEKPSEIESDRKTEQSWHIPKTEEIKSKPSFGLPASGVFGQRERETKVDEKKAAEEGLEFKASGSLPRQEKVEAEISEPAQEIKKKTGRSVGWLGFFSWRKKRRETDKEKTNRPEVLKKDQDDGKKRGQVLDVNLIPEELAGDPSLELSRKLFSGGLIIFIFIVLIAVGYLGIAWYQLKITREIEEARVEIVGLDQEIAKYDQDKKDALELQRHLKLVSQLLESHVYWTKFFSLLEKYTVSDVYYTDFSMAGTDKLVISAVGRDYESVAQQIVAFQQAADFVKSVKIDAATAEIDGESGVYTGVSFDINLEFLPEVFLKPINN